VFLPSLKLDISFWSNYKVAFNCSRAMFVLEEDLFHSYITCSLGFEPDLLSLNHSNT